MTKPIDPKHLEAARRMEGPYTKGSPIASVGGTPYGIDGPSVVGGLYNRTRAKRLIAQLNSAYAQAKAEDMEEIENRRNLIERLGKYAQHLNGCEALPRGLWPSRESCTCGLTELLTEVDQLNKARSR